MTTSSLAEVALVEVNHLDIQMKLLEELVNIGSDTKVEIKGVNKAQDIVARELKRLKFKVEMIANPDPLVESGKLLVATLPGKSDQFITLVTHVDTVFPALTGFVKFEKLSDQEARGPGIIDNKGGVVVLIEALHQFLKEVPVPEYSLRVVVSPSEEVGSTGFLNLYGEYSQNSVAVFGLEPALDDGDVVTARRGDRWYEVTVKGREAHAGRAHDKGVNACHELAVKIEKLQKLTDYKKEVSINIGAMRGGRDKFAIVCGEATANLDVRFSDTKNRDIILKKVEAILNTQYLKAKSDGAKASTEFKIVDDPKPFAANAETKLLADFYVKIIQQLEGKTIAAKRSGGTSDVNFFYRPGLTIIDGLGPVGRGMHTHEETLQIRSLATRAQALAKLLQATNLQ